MTDASELSADADMKLALIWAMSRNRVIGRNNALPWHLSEDLKYFKRITMGKPIIMGRKTWESIARPLPGRTNIVITRRADYAVPEGVKVFSSLDAALELAEKICLINALDETIVIGGAEIYALALPKADRLYLTQVHADVQGDAYFPQIDLDSWHELGRKDFMASGPNPYDYSFLVLER